MDYYKAEFWKLLLSRVELGEAPQVKAAATVFQNLCYNYRDQLVAGIICAGWDRRNGGQVQIIYISILSLLGVKILNN